MRKTFTTPNLPSTSTRPPSTQFKININSNSVASLTSIKQQNEINIANELPMIIEKELDDKYFDAPSISADSSILVVKSRKTLGNISSENIDRPRLIGKINPNILKTWEQLIYHMEDDYQNRECNQDSIVSEENQRSSTVLFIRKQHNFSGPAEEKFLENKVYYDRESGGDSERFYDSIDSFAVEGFSDNGLIDYLPTAAGDGMADIDSLELKNNSLKLWSIES